jgi:hypothetical protein
MYTVTIKKEGSEYVARDSNGDWRARGKFDKERTGMDLATYLFHEIELVGISTENGVTTATIKEAYDE